MSKNTEADKYQDKSKRTKDNKTSTKKETLKESMEGERPRYSLSRVTGHRTHPAWVENHGLGGDKHENPSTQRIARWSEINADVERKQYSRVL